MKNKLSTAVGIIIMIVLTAFLIGCQEANSPQDDSFFKSDLSVFDKTDLEGGIQDATFDTDAMFKFPIGKSDFIRHDHDPGKSGRHLFMILKRLNLSEEQLIIVKGFFVDHKSCVTPLIAEFKLIVEPILADLNAQKRLIIQQVRDGLITREQAMLMIRALNQAAREQIRNNPDVQAIQVEICNCKLTLFDSIASILTGDQLIIWNQWVANLQGPCSGN